MCFNFNASMIAFTIGEVTGALLTRSRTQEYRNIGYVVMFFTLIQLLEALIYKHVLPMRLLSFLIQLNLGALGLFFFALIQPWGFYFWSCLAISVFVAVDALTDSRTVTLTPKLKWNMSPSAAWMITLMYVLLFSFCLLTPKYNITAYVILGMYVLSSVIAYFSKKYSPSLWCLFSSIGSPFLLFFMK